MSNALIWAAYNRAVTRCKVIADYFVAFVRHVDLVPFDYRVRFQMPILPQPIGLRIEERHRVDSSARQRPRRQIAQMVLAVRVVVL